MPNSIVQLDFDFPSETILDKPWIADVFGNDGVSLVEQKAMDIAPDSDASASDDAAFGIGTGNGSGSALGWLATLGSLAVKVAALFLPLAHS